MQVNQVLAVIPPKNEKGAPTSGALFILRRGLL